MTDNGITHHTATINGDDLHWVSAGSGGTPVLLVHGFPESWWAFRRLIPLLAAEHRVIAVDLPGFGDSAVGDFTSATMAESLCALIVHLGLGPVHLTGQDISGTPTFRLAARHPELLRSFTAIETTFRGTAWRRSPTWSTAAAGTSASWPRPASPNCCWPAANANS